MLIISWIKNHKLMTLLILIILYLVFSRNSNFPIVPPVPQMGVALPDYAGSPQTSRGVDMQNTMLEKRAAPLSTDRLVIKNSNLSLVVNDVESTGDKIVSYAKGQGGFMVYVSYSRPSESPFGQITVRVPSDKLDEALKYFKSLSIKVTSENLVGTDVTDQYVDIQARLAQLRKTQSKLSELLDKATQVQDILAVQQQLSSIQEQIDSLVGQQKALEQKAKLTEVTIFLSTDELALPYTPDTTFRPAVVFKQAVRSLLSTFRVGAEGAIWLAVYSVIIIPAYLLYHLIRHRMQKTE